MAGNGWTNRGKANVKKIVFQGEAAPANFYLALVTNATEPSADTNTLSDLTEIADTNGYTEGGELLNRNDTDFTDPITNAFLNITGLYTRKVTWTASGGNLPVSGAGASWAVLLGPHATPASREVWAYWKFPAAQSLVDTEKLNVDNTLMYFN